MTPSLRVEFDLQIFRSIFHPCFSFFFSREVQTAILYFLFLLLSERELLPVALVVVVEGRTNESYQPAVAESFLKYRIEGDVGNIRNSGKGSGVLSQRWWV